VKRICALLMIGLLLLCGCTKDPNKDPTGESTVDPTGASSTAAVDYLQNVKDLARQRMPVYDKEPVIEFDPNLPYYQWERDQGQYPKVYAMAYKYVYIDGKLESKTPLYEKQDYYRPTPAYWRVGTGGMSQEEFLASLPEGTVLYPPE